MDTLHEAEFPFFSYKVAEMNLGQDWHAFPVRWLW